MLTGRFVRLKFLKDNDMKKALLLMILVIGLGGCAFGTKVKESDLSRIHEGQTTKAEMAKMLGKPQATQTTSYGKDIYTWRYERTQLGVLSDTHYAQSLHVLFDKNGVVEKYRLSNNERETNIFTMHAPQIAAPPPNEW